MKRPVPLPKPGPSVESVGALQHDEPSVSPKR
jgi:hypothetical protein